jgi:predicted porin
MVTIQSNKFLFTSFGIFCFCASQIAVALDDPGPINTERPSFSSSPLALAKGYWQIETGYQYTRNNDPFLKDHTLPNALLRYGFYEKLELQLNSAGYTWKNSEGQETNGHQDASLGIKWQVNESDALVPIGLFGGVSLPVGSAGFSNDDYDPTMALYWSYSGSLAWFGTAKLTHSSDLFTLDNAVGINFSLADNTGAYLEYLGNFYEDDARDSAQTLNLGATYLLSNDLQADVSGGAGLNSSANDYHVGIGLSYRIR